MRQGPVRRQGMNQSWRAGFHTFDYARHFMSCCSRMLGLEHVASRGSISIEYYGRDVGIKIMPTGVKPERFLNGFGWQDTIWRRGELLSQVTRLHPVDCRLPSQLWQTPLPRVRWSLAGLAEAACRHCCKGLQAESWWVSERQTRYQAWKKCVFCARMVCVP